MKTRLVLFALISVFSLPPSDLLQAGTSIDTANHFAYGANIGWMDWRGDTAHGAVIGEYICTGYIYSANVGWIGLGSGAPADGIYYQNNSATDWGVNQDGLGNLRGYAWGANIGWLNFENTGAPKVDLLTGKLSGFVWSANCGWISLSNAVAYVQTDTVQQGVLAPDGLPIAWLLANFGTTNINAGADADMDGMSNQQEYLAGTNPKDANDYLRITSITRGGSPHAPTYTILNWTAEPTRYYIVQERPSLGTGAWADYANLPMAGWSNLGFDDYDSTNEFFRVRAYRPLTP